MIAQHDIWLADLVRAAALLRPATARAEDALAGLLGFAPRRTQQRAEPKPDQRRPSSIATDPGPPRAPPMTPPRPPVDDKSPAGAALLQPTRTERIEPSERWSTVGELERPAERHRSRRLQHQPLFQPRWQRELAVALTALHLPYGLVDARRAVKRVARGEPIASIPRVQRWSVNRGVQLLVDLGVGSEPFRRDHERFTALLQATLGRERVALSFFWGCPARGVCPEESGERAYSPPAPGVPVLLLSDLGFAHGDGGGSGAPAEEWIAFAGTLRRQGSRAVALVTREATYFPGSLARTVTIIPWRNGTTQRTVREALGRS